MQRSFLYGNYVVAQTPSQLIGIGQISAPTLPNHPATRIYVDQKIGNMPTFQDPIHLDVGTNVVSALPASDTQSGVVTIGAQIFAGSKTITVPDAPSGDHVAVNSSYVESIVGGISATAPLAYNPSTHTISIPAAGPAAAGYVTTGDQAFAGNKTISVPIPDPINLGDTYHAAPRTYVDTASSYAAETDSPIVVTRDILHGSTIGITAANNDDPLHPVSGYVTTKAQSFSGLKTIDVPTPIEGDDTKAVPKSYVDGKTAITSTSPISFSPTKVISMTPAQYVASPGTSVAGYVTTTSQQFPGAKDFPDGITVPNRTAGESTANAANTAFVRGETNGTGFAANNGWVTGGFLDRSPSLWNPDGSKVDVNTEPPPMTPQFTISEIKVRFTIADDEVTAVTPIRTDVLTFFTTPVVYTVDITLWTSNTVGVYIDRSGVVHQRALGTDVSKMFDWVQVGTLLMVQITNPYYGIIPGADPMLTVIINVANVKYPLANNYDLVVMDFINHLTPLNLGPMTISASTDTVLYPLGIHCSGGQLWEQMANIWKSPYMDINRTVPSLMTVPAVDAPDLYGIWITTPGPGGWNADQSLGKTLDITQYNPNGMGARVPIPAGEWVNIPIVYNAATSLFAMQYPTASYTDSNAALLALGKFVRVQDLSFALFNIIGYVTVQQGVTDLSAATFSSGEYFNYSVGGASGSTGGGGGGGASYTRSNCAWVDIMGSDTTGQWNVSSLPFNTYHVAALNTTAPSLENNYVTEFSLGKHEDNEIDMRPFVNLNGVDPRGASVSSTNGVTLAGAWSTTSPCQICLSSIMFINGTSVDFTLYGNSPKFGLTTSTKSNLYMTSCMMMQNAAVSPGTLTFKGRMFTNPAYGDYFTAYTNDISANIVIDGGIVIFQAIVHDSAYSMTISSTNAYTHFTANGCVFGSVTINAPGPYGDMITCVGTMFSGTLTVNPGATIRLDRSCSVPNLVNNGTVIYIDFPTNWWDGLNSAAHAITISNPVVDTTTLNDGLGTKLAANATVNGRSFTAGACTVQAGDLPSGGTKLNHVLLDIQSGDLPASIASNTSGTAGGLLSTAVLPDGVKAATQAYTDNSTLLATTAFITGQKAQSSGIATLDGTGKLTAAQIPASLVGALKYMGSWSAAGGVYPDTPSQGNFWVISVGGTMTYGGVPTTFVSGDWCVWNGASWDKIDNQNVAAYLATWAGSSSLITVGTVTSGTWHAGAIESSYGGAKGVTGILKTVDNTGAVSAASAGTDYLSPSVSATISGAYTYSTIPAISASITAGEYTTNIPTTAWIRTNANKPQNNIVYVSAAGSDSLTNTDAGKTISYAFKTFAHAVTVFGSPINAAAGYVIKCADAGVNTDTAIVLPSFVSIEAPYASFTCNISIPPDSFVCLGTWDGTGGTAITFSADSNSHSSYFIAKQVVAGKFVVNAAASPTACRYVTCGDLALGAGSNGLTMGANCTVYVACQKLSGGITGAASSSVDMGNVSDFSAATVTPNGGTIKYPCTGVGSLSQSGGVVYYNGSGSFSIASAGTQYLVNNQPITLSGVVTGGPASTSITTAIANNALSLAMLPQVTRSVVGNFSGDGSAGNCTSIPLKSTSVASTDGGSVMYRDSNVNSAVNNLAQNYTQVSSLAYQIQLADSGNLWYNLSQNSSTILPQCRAAGVYLLQIGFKYLLINLSPTYTLGVYTYGNSTLVGTIPAMGFAYVICRDNGNSPGTWDWICNSPISITGSVVGTGTTSINTTLAPVSTGNVLGYFGGSATGEPVAKTCDSAQYGNTTYPPVAGSVMRRDAVTGNCYINNLTTTLNRNSSTSTVTLTNADAALQYFIGNPGPGTVKLPNVTTCGLGFSMTLYNATGDASAIAVQNNGGSAIVSMASGTAYSFAVIVVTSDAASSWKATPINPPLSFSGDVTGSGTNGTVTNMAISGLALSKLATITSGSVLGNTGSGNTSVPYSSSFGVGVNLVSRDTNGNSQINCLAQNFNTQASSSSADQILVTSAPTRQYTGTTQAQQVNLPAIAGMVKGYTIRIINAITGANITVYGNGGVSGGSLPQTILPFYTYDFVCTSTSTETSWAIVLIQGVSITGDVTGSSNSAGALSSTISGLAYSKLATIAGPGVLGSMTSGAGQTVATVTPQATPGASTLVMRDASSNTAANTLTQNFSYAASSSSTDVLTVTSSPIRCYTGTTQAQQVNLPLTSTLVLGYRIRVINLVSGANVTVYNSTGSSTSVVIPSYFVYDFVCNSVSSNVINTGWIPVLINGTTLTGDATGSMTSTGSISTSISGLAFSKLATITSGSVLGNSGSGNTSLAYGSIYGTSNIVSRDASGNSQINNCIENFTTQTGPSSNIFLTASSAPVQRFTGSGSGTQLIILPSVTSLAVGFTFTIYNEMTAAGITLYYNNGSGGAGGITSTISASNNAVVICNSTSTQTAWYTTITTMPGLSAIANNTVLGNISGGSANPTAITLDSGSSASSVVQRDSDANVDVNVLVEGVQSKTAAATLTSASAATQVFTSITSSITVALPSATTLSVGHKYNIVNDSQPVASYTGIIQVTNGSSDYLCNIYPNYRAKFVLVSNSTTAGSWTWYYKSRIPPQLFLATSMTTGSYYFTTSTTLTAAQVYAGVISGSGTIAFTFPTASNLVGTSNANGLWNILGCCPHIGFNFPLSINNQGGGTLSVSTNTGCTIYGSSLGSSSQYYTLQLWIWITSPTSYIVLNSRDY